MLAEAFERAEQSCLGFYIEISTPFARDIALAARHYQQQLIDGGSDA